MKTLDLPAEIDGDIQNYMADVFETLMENQTEDAYLDVLLVTEQYYAQALALLNTTDYLTRGDNPALVNALIIDIESGETDPMERLAHAWMVQKTNLELAESQENFNATFAIFVPVILHFMAQAKA
uniref:hypothetical protein n=1 Tax=Thaumasiovibrio occultus TaxID=1891184 RepID=UPI000B351BC2|nr:hypothetical protein [Thaumasiovibrio occultus]